MKLTFVIDTLTMSWIIY